MKKWNLLFIISCIIIFQNILISTKNLKHSLNIDNNILKEDSNITCPDNCKDGLCDESTKKCYSCKDGYYSDDCSEQCPTKNCQNCDQDSSLCNQCINDLILIDNYCCEKICEKCDDEGCTECSDPTKYGKECINCPENCYYENKNRKCDQNSGECFSCISGKRGIKCDQNCNEGCDLSIKNCDMNDGTCTCKEGYYGTKCENICDSNCLSCDKTSGKCNQCKSGYYPNEKSCIKCPDNCDGECPEGICQKCKKGFYSDICDKTCSIFCKDNICNKDDGLCDCINYFKKETYCTECINQFDIGTNCTECKGNYNKSQECNQCIDNYDIKTSCKECINHYTLSSKCSQCEEHFTLDSKCSKCESNFDIDSNCKNCINHFDIKTECKDCLKNYYGEKCDIKCAEGCDTSIKNCDKKDGYCEQCIFPYYGYQCENKSEIEHCIKINKTSGECLQCESKFYLTDNTCQECSKNCKDSLCFDYTGDCIECASENTYGDKCEKNCSQFCNVIIGGNICQRKNGECNNGCINTGNFSDKQCTECTDGYYPRSEGCNTKCSINCLDPFCDKENGYCKECALGFWNNRCDKECDALCRFSCSHDVGICDECVDGWYKDSSATTAPGCIECPKNCSKCQNSEKCDACKDGKFGQKCEEDCSPHCKDNQCDINGNCPCQNKYYGEQCALDCNGCAENGCDDKNGICSDHYCSEKFYDPRRCNYTCGDKCGSDGRCDLYTGECIICEKSKWGKNCEEDCPKECEGDDRVDCCFAKKDEKGKGIKINILNKKKNSLDDNQDEFDLIKINLGGFDLKIIADFETNSPLMIFDKSTEIKKTETEIYNISIDLLYDSLNSTNYTEDISSNEYYEYNGFSLIKEKQAKDRLILGDNVIDNFTFLICQEYKIDKEFDNAGKINGIVGLGLRNYFTENLFWANLTNKLPKNIVIKYIKDNSIYIGDYNDDIRASFTNKLSTMEIDNKKSIVMKKLISFETSFTGIAYSLRKAYKYEYDKKVELNNRIETIIVFNNLYKQFFEKIYFGDLFNNGCYLRSLQGGEVEYYCDKNKAQAIQNLPKLGLILGDYIYYLSHKFLFKESGQFITFIIKLHGQSQQKIQLGKSFFDEFSVVYNNGNETLNFFSDNIKKLNVPLRDPSNLLNIDSDVFTPGGWVTLIVFLTSIFIIVCYLSKYCLYKNDEDESEEDEIEDDDDEPLIDDTLE